MRTEVEISITHEQYAQLWPLTEGKRLRKLRYIIPYQKHKIELDVYEEPLKGLLIAEVEFADTASSENFQAPEWFGREVTGIAEYSNFYLATEGRYFE